MVLFDPGGCGAEGWCMSGGREREALSMRILSIQAVRCENEVVLFLVQAKEGLPSARKRLPRL